MILIIWVVLSKTDLLSLLSIQVSWIKSQILSILFVSIGWLKISWMAERILLELLSVNALDDLRLLLASAKHWWELLAIIT